MDSRIEAVRWAQSPECARARRLFAVARLARERASNDHADAAALNDEARDLAPDSEQRGPTRPPTHGDFKDRMPPAGPWIIPRQWQQ